MAPGDRWFVVRDGVVVRAPIERCFALSTHLAVVEMTLAMRPPRGRRSGAVVGGDRVRWRGWKWGLPQVHESAIEAFNPPVFFRDQMIAGRFAAFKHDHYLERQEDGCVLLQDELRFRMRWGAAGLLIARGVVDAAHPKAAAGEICANQGTCGGRGVAAVCSSLMRGMSEHFRGSRCQRGDGPFACCARKLVA